MSAEPAAETSQSYELPPMLDSESSDEEHSQDEGPAISWSDLSIIERVGLNSVEMSEKDVEAAFSQITLAFCCDQYTLKQRLQAEEHARNLAEENVQLELTRGRETLEMLKGLCLDSTRSKILQKLELSLDILAGTVERISSTAEVLGAVHQEARVSRAVELMVSHVESLKRRYDRNAAELEEVKRTLQQQQNLCRNIDPRASSDPEENDNRKKASQNNLRRRVSISLIPSQIQEKKKQDSKKQVSPGQKSLPSCPSPSQSSESSCSAMTKDDAQSVEDRPAEVDETPPEAPAAPPPPEHPPAPEPNCPPSKPVTIRKAQNKNSSLDTLRQRHKVRAAVSKRKEKKTSNIYRRISATTCAPLWRSHPQTLWLYRCRWALLGTYLFVLFCVVSLTYFLWKLQDGVSEI